MLKQFCFWFTILSITLLSAQNNLSFNNDIFSGINSSLLFPTHTYLNPNPWDVNLISSDTFFYNNYAYISKESLLGLSDAKIETTQPKKNITGANQANVLDFYTDRKVNLLLNSDVMGPSFSMTANINDKKYVFGLFTRSRTQASILDFDNYLRFGNQQIPQPSTYEMKPFSGISMNWNELGINVATDIFPNSDHQWIIGGNIKYEMGLDAAHIVSRKNVRLTVSDPAVGIDTDRKNIYASDYDISADYITNYNSEKKSYKYKQNGSGIGLDFGIIILDKGPREDNYDSRISFSILDLGYINFKQGLQHRFVNGKTIWLQNNPNLENQDFKGPEDFLKALSQEAYGNPNQSLAGNGFLIGLPTSININYSRKIKPEHYINVNWIQRIPVFKNSLKRNNVLNVNYTIQKSALGYGFSSSLSEYKNLEFGGYFRIGPLILGSENIFPLIFKHDHLHAASFYAAIKLYPFWDNDMKRHRRKKCDCEK